MLLYSVAYHDCCFVWGCSIGVAGIHHVVPDVPGLTPKSGLTLVGVYIIGRFYRYYEGIMNRIHVAWHFIVFLFSMGVCTIGMGWFGTYNSPFAVMLALTSFHIVRQLPMPKWLGVLAIWISPSVFSVYIMHANGVANLWLHHGVIELKNLGVPAFGCLTVIMITVYICGICADLPRRSFLAWINKASFVRRKPT